MYNLYIPANQISALLTGLLICSNKKFSLQILTRPTIQKYLYACLLNPKRIINAFYFVLNTYICKCNHKK